MRYFLIALTSIFSSWLNSSLNAQTKNLNGNFNAGDSIANIIQSTLDDSSKVQLLLRLAETVPDPTVSIKFAQQALDLAEKLKDDVAIQNALFQLAFISNVGGDWAKGMEWAFTGIERAKSVDQLQYLSPFLNMVALSFDKQRDYSSALKWSRMAIQALGRTARHSTDRWGAHMTTAGLMAKLNMNHDSVIYFARKSIILGKEDGISEALNGYSYAVMARSFGNISNSDSARHYYHKALRLFMQSGGRFSVPEVKRDLALLYQRWNEKDSTRYYASQAYEEAQTVRNLDVLVDVSYLLFRYYEPIDEKRAYGYLKRYDVLKDSLFNKDKYNQIYLLQSTEKQKQQEIEKRAIEASAQKRQSLLTLGGSLLALTALGLGFILRQKQRSKTKLEAAYAMLKSSQAQLIQSEKMASLGELTAGIAHEIQNPLNFVNNFSEVNAELVSDLEKAVNDGNLMEVSAIVKNLKENEAKIAHHGKRADGIVKSMLQHSRKRTGQKELTDINALCDEYFRLAYHGLRAKDKSFNAKFETNFDASLPKIGVVPQEMGRVILNLINNAFYAVNERLRHAQPDTRYEPKVMASTKNLGDKIEIRISDNGTGIPEQVKEKIFQPFFTTKPTGQGTGLGLSLSYDVVKAHGGELKLETKEGEGSEFVIHLSTAKA